MRFGSYPRSIPLLAAFIAVVVVLAGCGGGKQTNRANGLFHLGTVSGIDSPNPFVGVTQDSYNAWEYIYPHLVEYGRGAQIVPSFATKWSVSHGGLKWTFDTVADAKWSDGRPLTSQDVAWTYNTVRRFQTSVAAGWASYVHNMVSVRATSPTTVVITLSAPTANLLDNVQGLPILPAHIWSAHVGRGGAGLKTFADAAPIVSGGPFVLTKFQANNVALFGRNPHYWGPKPTLAGFGLQVFSNPDAMTSALQSGQLDGIESVPPTAVAALSHSKSITVLHAPGLAESALFINLGPSAPPELREAQVRAALDLATDRQALVQTVDLGHGQPAAGMIPYASGWADPRLKPTPFDPAKANSILNHLGFIKGPDGIRSADGHKMKYTVLTVSSDPGIDARFRILQHDYATIGIALTQSTMDNNAWAAAVNAKGKPGKGWSLAINSNTAVVDPTGFLSIFTCNSGYFQHYCNPAYDKTLAAATSATSQQDRRAGIYALEDMVATQRLMITLDYLNAIDAQTSSWTGFTMTGQGTFNQFSTRTMTHLRQQ